MVDGLEIINLHLHGRSPPPAAKMPLDGDSNRRIRQRSGHTSMRHSSAVAQVIAESARDGDAVAVHLFNSHTQQSIERNSAQQIAGFLNGEFALMQAPDCSSHF